MAKGTSAMLLAAAIVLFAAACQGAPHGNGPAAAPGDSQPDITGEAFRHGLTAAQVASELLREIDSILAGEIFGVAPSLASEDAIAVGEDYASLELTEGIYGWPFTLLLSYTVEENKISWSLVGSDNPFISERYFQPRAPRTLTGRESVTVRFHYHCTELDPGVLLLPEAYLYVAEEIPGHRLWEEFIRLMYEHTSIRVWDLWFEGSKLYVDLHSTEEVFFNWGSTGSYDRGTRLQKTLASLPGVASFEVLVGGDYGVMTSHYDFNWVAVVENGEIVGHEPGRRAAP